MNNYKVAFIISGYPYLYLNKNNELTGIYYDCWEKLKKEINDVHYTNDIITTEKRKEFYKNLKSYHIIIGLHSQYFIHDDFDVSEKLFLTKPIFVYNEVQNKKLSFVQEIENRSEFLSLAIDVGKQPFTLFMMLGVILGFFIYITKRDRGLVNSIYTVYSSILQESGRLIDRSDTTLKLKNVIHLLITLFVLIVSFFFAMYLQAKTTAAIVYAAEIDDSSDTLFIETLKEKRIITPNFPQIVTHFDKNNIQYKIYDILDEETILDKLDQNDVDAIVLDSEKAKYLSNLDNYYQSSYPLGYTTEVILIHKNNPEMLKKINYQINELKKTDYIKNTCEIYSIHDLNMCNV